MSLTSHLLCVADVYRSVRGISISRLSTLLFNDGKRLGGIAVGGDLQTRSYERAMRWLSDNWPAGAEWPDGVARPDGAASSEPAPRDTTEGAAP